MRTLKFIVDGQTLKQDPNCDFSGLVPGTEGHLYAEFSFSRDWENCVKVAAFYSVLGREYEPQKLNWRGSCVIPVEALEKKTFKIQIVGRNGESLIRTNKLAITQKGGKV